MGFLRGLLILLSEAAATAGAIRTAAVGAAAAGPIAAAASGLSGTSAAGTSSASAAGAAATSAAGASSSATAAALLISVDDLVLEVRDLLINSAVFVVHIGDRVQKIADPFHIQRRAGCCAGRQVIPKLQPPAKRRFNLRI